MLSFGRIIGFVSLLKESKRQFLNFCEFLNATHIYCIFFQLFCTGLYIPNASFFNALSFANYLGNKLGLSV